MVQGEREEGGRGREVMSFRRQINLIITITVVSRIALSKETGILESTEVVLKVSAFAHARINTHTDKAQPGG